MFDSWTDDQFAAWLAGFFDGEGCIYLGNKKAYAFEMSLSNTVREVIESIHIRMQVGYLMEVTYNRAEWNTKYTWRVRKYEECYKVLQMITPFLVIKKVNALEGIRRYEEAVASKQALDARNEQIKEMVASGIRRSVIASQFGISQSLITGILKGRRGIGKMIRNFSSVKSYREKHERPDLGPSSTTFQMLSK